MAYGKGSKGAKHDLKAGLTRKSPKVPDSSMGCSGPSVDKDATRSTVARGHSLGPRDA